MLIWRPDSQALFFREMVRIAPEPRGGYAEQTGKGRPEEGSVQGGQEGSCVFRREIPQIKAVGKSPKIQGEDQGTLGDA